LADGSCRQRRRSPNIQNSFRIEPLEPSASNFRIGENLQVIGVGIESRLAGEGDMFLNELLLPMPVVTPLSVPDLSLPLLALSVVVDTSAAPTATQN
jgi:hypothetical protein